MGCADHGYTRNLTTFSLVGLILLSLAAPSGAHQRPGITEWISVPAIELKPSVGEKGATTPDVSVDGRYVVWDSNLDNLVLDDTNGMPDVFRRDRKSGVTRRVSVASDGAQAMGPCLIRPQDASNGTVPSIVNPGWPSSSANGRWVAFTSCAENLVPGDTNMAQDVFLHDAKTGTTELISVAPDGSQASGPPFWNLRSTTSSNSISADGRYVAFASLADNLVPGDTNGDWDVFLRDTREDKTERVSITSQETESHYVFQRDLSGPRASDDNPEASVSADGRYVAFQSTASDLTPSDGDELLEDCFVRDRREGVTELVSVSRTIKGGEEDAGEASFCSISADGRYVAFSSNLSMLIPSDNNFQRCAYGPGSYDAFVFDRMTSRTRRVSVTSNGAEVCESGAFGNVDISGNGRFVVFTSRSGTISDKDPATNPVPVSPGEYSTFNDTYLHDLVTGETELVSLTTYGGAPEDGEASGVAISRLGQWVVFYSADKLNPGEGAIQIGELTVDEPTGKHVWLRERSLPVGGALSPGHPGSTDSPSKRVCMGSDACLGPQHAYSVPDGSGDSPPLLGGFDLIEVNVAYRPNLGDLFFAQELENLPILLDRATSSGALYGLSFLVNDTRYEVRATSLSGGHFGLFDCTTATTCTKIRDLDGGYGTTGHRVVFSIPLDEIGLSDGGRMTGVQAYTAIGGFESGPIRLVDQLDVTDG